MLKVVNTIFNASMKITTVYYTLLQDNGYQVQFGEMSQVCQYQQKISDNQQKNISSEKVITT